MAISVYRDDGSRDVIQNLSVWNDWNNLLDLVSSITEGHTHDGADSKSLVAGSLPDHASRHENGGADELSIAGLAGESTELATHKATSQAHSDYLKNNANDQTSGTLAVLVTSTTAFEVGDTGGINSFFNVDTVNDITKLSNPRPFSDNGIDLGTSGVRWKDIFLAGNLSDGTNALTVANAKTAYDHSQDNSQAHSDYLKNDANDTTSGKITASGGFDAGDSDIVNVGDISLDSISSDTGAGINILPAATGDVELFGDTDVGDDDAGKYLIIHRKAAEGDHTFRIFLDHYGNTTLTASNKLNLNSLPSRQIELNSTGGIGITLFEWQNENRYFRQYGYITADTSRKYIQWKVSDITDNFELTRQDSNIAAFDIQMPLMADSISRIGGATNHVQISNTGDVVFVGSGGLAVGEISAYNAGEDVDMSDGSGIANKEQITAFDTNGASNNTTPDHTNDHITITKAGMYLCTVSMHVDSQAGSAATFGFGAFKNNGDIQFNNVHGHIDMPAGAGGNAQAVPMSGIIDLAVNDTVEIWVWNEDNTQDITIDDITLTLVQVGGT